MFELRVLPWDKIFFFALLQKNHIINTIMTVIRFILTSWIRRYENIVNRCKVKDKKRRRTGCEWDKNPIEFPREKNKFKKKY